MLTSDLANMFISGWTNNLIGFLANIFIDGQANMFTGVLVNMLTNGQANISITGLANMFITDLAIKEEYTFWQKKLSSEAE